MKIACLTVIYPEMMGSIDEYAENIRRQTCKDFELVVVNDGVTGDFKTALKKVPVPVLVFDCSLSHQKNRLFGLSICQKRNYDVVICSDSDEIMAPERVQRIREFFMEHKEESLVFNNVVSESNGRRFDLAYKDTIRLDDIVDFNVLGYGAMSLRRDLIPFVLEHENSNITVFDWWLALVYLIKYPHVRFLSDLAEQARYRKNTLVGPAFEISGETIQKSLKIKKTLYMELAQYCRKQEITDKDELFSGKLDEIHEIEKFIKVNSLPAYLGRVKKYFESGEKLYWWRDAVSLSFMEKSNV